MQLNTINHLQRYMDLHEMKAIIKISFVQVSTIVPLLDISVYADPPVKFSKFKNAA